MHMITLTHILLFLTQQWSTCKYRSKHIWIFESAIVCVTCLVKQTTKHTYKLEVICSDTTVVVSQDSTLDLCSAY